MEKLKNSTAIQGALRAAETGAGSIVLAEALKNSTAVVLRAAETGAGSIALAEALKNSTAVVLRAAETGAGSIALAVKPKVACKMLSVGTTRLYELLASDELTSYLDGRSRMITTDSIYAYVARRIAASRIAG